MPVSRTPMISKLVAISEGRVSIRPGSDHQLSKHFRAIDKGRFDTISWKKDDVGNYAKSYKDSHGFKSVYIRFKGSKSSKVIPWSLFKKYFVAVSKTDTDALAKWSKPASKNNKPKTLKKEEKKMAAAKSLDTVQIAEEIHYAIRKEGDKFVLYKDMKGMSFRVASGKDISKIRAKMNDLKSKATAKQNAAKTQTPKDNSDSVDNKN